jgi:predicted transcriptional regulator
MIGWTAADLAREAEVGLATIRRFENGGDARQSSVTAMVKAFEAAGIQFISAGEFSAPGGAGLRKVR